MLIVQPDHLGDILLSQPAVRLIRRAFPDRRLVGVVGPWSEQIAKLAWSVDSVVTLPFPGFDRQRDGSVADPYVTLLESARQLRPIDAGTAVVLRPDAWWAAWLAAMVCREVVASEDSRVKPFATRAMSVGDDHAVRRALAIASGTLDHNDTREHVYARMPLELPHDPRAAEEARRLLRSRGVTGPYAVVHPGAGAVVKEWPEHSWAGTVRAMSDLGLQVVLSGSRSESATTNLIGRGAPQSVSIAGQTGLDVLIEVLRGASVVVGPDTGPLHLAVATGTSTVHLFGPSDPGRYGPWGNPACHRIVRAGWSCPRCGDLSPARGSGCACMVAITVADVLGAVEQAMAARG